MFKLIIGNLDKENTQRRRQGAIDELLAGCDAIAAYSGGLRVKKARTLSREFQSSVEQMIRDLVDRAIEMVRQERESGEVSQIVIAHNYLHVLETCDRVCLLQNGRITFDRAVDEVDQLLAGCPGDDPAALPRTYATAINQALAGRPAGMTVTMHTCRGNFRSTWLASGGYEDAVVEAMFFHLTAPCVECAPQPKPMPGVGSPPNSWTRPQCSTMRPSTTRRTSKTVMRTVRPVGGP